MSNPYGWAPPTGQGQQAVYFARPGESVAAPPPAPGYGPSAQPYDNGYQQYASFSAQYGHDPYRHDPFADLDKASRPQFLRQLGQRPNVSIGDAATLWFKNWRNFSGRASPSEYWGVRIILLLFRVLWWVLIYVVAQMNELTPSDPIGQSLMLGVLGIGLLLSAIVAIPTLSLTVRRLHDTNHSGWNLLLLYLPVASLMISYYFARRSDDEGWRFDDVTQPLYGLDDI